MKPLSLLSSAAIVAGLAFGVASQADATTFKFDWERADGGHLGQSEVDTDHNQRIWINNGAGAYETLTTTYNDETERLTFSASFADGGNPIDGGWVVISDGRNPKGQGQEFSIFYLDGDNNRVTAYAYNGQNSSNSWRHQEFLGSWDNLKFEDGDGTSSLSFSLDMTDINARTDIDPDWKGTRFGEQVGVWFHAGQNTSVSYGQDEAGEVNEITHFSSHAKWYDSNALDTEAVPEPTSLLAFGLIGGAFAVSRRRNQNGPSTEGDAAMA